MAAETASLQLASAERAGLVSGTQLNEIAIKGRDLFGFLSTLPGVVNTNGGGSQTLDIGAIGGLSMNGNRAGSSNIAVDGVTAFPSGANFVLLRVHSDGHALWQRLVDRGVLVRDFSGWPRLAGCLRVTVGTPEENDAFLAALREAVEEVRVA